MSPPTQYFDADPATPSRRRTVVLALPDRTVRLETDRGVFGADAIDPGTHFLLTDAPAPDAAETTTIADIGCGYGPIAITSALRAPGSHVWAVDVNARARALCTDNAAAAGVENITVAAPEDVPATLRLDRIYANPPIRIGKTALHDLLSTWLDRLTPEGRAWLVVHKHLGSDSLARWLTAEGWPTTRLGSRRGYRILEVRPSPTPTPPQPEIRPDIARDG